VNIIVCCANIDLVKEAVYTFEAAKIIQVLKIPPFTDPVILFKYMWNVDLARHFR